MLKKIVACGLTVALSLSIGISALAHGGGHRRNKNYYCSYYYDGYCYNTYCNGNHYYHH